MNPIIAWTTIISLSGILMSATICAPFYLSDSGNKFLANFVGEGFLSLVGIILTITLASAASLHFEINKLQDRTGNPFVRTRAGLKRSVIALFASFTAAVVLVIIKPIYGSQIHATAAFNSAAIIIMLFELIILIDLTTTAFGIPAASILKEADASHPSAPKSTHR